MKHEHDGEHRTPDGGPDRLANAIRTAIVEGELPPGEPLRFRSLTGRYGVSVSALREAMARLHGEGFVAFAPGSGYRVIPATMEDFLDVARARLTVEVAAFGLSMDNADDDWEASVLATHHKLARATERLNASPSAKNAAAFTRCHKAFHLALVAGCGSQWLIAACADLRDRFDRCRLLLGAPTTAHPPLVTHHEPLCIAALSRQREEACRLLAEHIELAIEVVRGETVVVLGDPAHSRHKDATADTVCPAGTGVAASGRQGARRSTTRRRSRA